MSSVPKSHVLSIDLTSKLRSKTAPGTQTRKRDEQIFEKLSKLERILGIRPGGDFFPTPHVVGIDQIPICYDLANKSRFKKLIESNSHITHADICELTDQLTFTISCYESGSIPAALNPASDYSEHSWTRDTAIIAHALGASKHYTECQKALTHLAEFYARKEQRDRFVSFHYHDNPADKYRFGDRNRELPHIRAKIDSNGRMVESEQDWSHNQLDAIGMWLLVTFRAANLGILNLKNLDHYISKDVNPDNGIDSIFAVALKFLNRISFWQQHDHGPWEDKLEPTRASSVAMGVAAIKEALAFFECVGWKELHLYHPENGPTLKDEMQHALLEGQKALCARIPKSGAYAIETDRYPADSALSFLLFPFNPGLTAKQERAILKSLYSKRMGVVGFTRRDEDEYLGSDYAYNTTSACFCKLTQPDYKPAEWTLFDPLLAGYYFDRYIQSSGLDEESYALAERHLKRSIAAITNSDDSFIKAFDGRKISVQAGRVPEAYWYDSHEKRWRANENSPLLMAEAAYTMMLERALEASRLWDMVKSKLSHK